LNDQDIQQLYQLAHHPLLIVISGTSGSGKDSVVKALVKRMKTKGSPVHFVITATTRPKRADEVDGVDYFFVSKDEFESMIAGDELIEYALVYNQYKGVPKQQVREALASGKDVVMRLDVQGAATIRKMVPQAVLIFITAPSEKELIRRLESRATESPEQLHIRLETARQEMKRIAEFDYVIPNPDGKLDETVQAAMDIITAEKHRTYSTPVKL
jgi:guanylate kinase